LQSIQLIKGPLKAEPSAAGAFETVQGEAILHRQVPVPFDLRRPRVRRAQQPAEQGDPRARRRQGDKIKKCKNSAWPAAPHKQPAPICARLDFFIASFQTGRVGGGGRIFYIWRTEKERRNIKSSLHFAPSYFK
jgi:hypothetical protein